MFEEFKNQIYELITSLDLIGKGNLKFLSMKLDYNYYYTERENEKNYKNENNNFDASDQEDNLDENDGNDEAEGEAEEKELNENEMVDIDHEHHDYIYNNITMNSEFAKQSYNELKNDSSRKFNMNDFIYNKSNDNVDDRNIYYNNDDQNN
jgi:hypothetical protein